MLADHGFDNNSQHEHAEAPLLHHETGSTNLNSGDARLQGTLGRGGCGHDNSALGRGRGRGDFRGRVVNPYAGNRTISSRPRNPNDGGQPHVRFLQSTQPRNVQHMRGGGGGDDDDDVDDNGDNGDNGDGDYGDLSRPPHDNAGSGGDFPRHYNNGDGSHNDYAPDNAYSNAHHPPQLNRWNAIRLNEDSFSHINRSENTDT